MCATRLVGVAGLPRSGTTLVTSVLSVHSEIATSYEPWNASWETMCSVNTVEEFISVSGIDMRRKSVLVIKETSTEPKFIDSLRRLLITHSQTAQTDFVAIFRDPLHVFLSEHEARVKWWGEPNLVLTLPDFVNWARRAIDRILAIIDMIVTFRGVALSYECLTKHPDDTIPKLMTQLGLVPELSQIQYERHLDVSSVRGDQSLIAGPVGISDNSTLARREEVSQKLQVWSGTEAYQALESVGLLTKAALNSGVCRLTPSDVEVFSGNLKSLRNVLGPITE